MCTRCFPPKPISATSAARGKMCQYDLRQRSAEGPVGFRAEAHGATWPICALVVPRKRCCGPHDDLAVGRAPSAARPRPLRCGRLRLASLSPPTATGIVSREVGREGLCAPASAERPRCVDLGRGQVQGMRSSVVGEEAMQAANPGGSASARHNSRSPRRGAASGAWVSTERAHSTGAIDDRQNVVAGFVRAHAGEVADQRLGPFRTGGGGARGSRAARAQPGLTSRPLCITNTA